MRLSIPTLREPAWRSEGEDPDYRFSLANERTYLAWMRTVLALIGGGVLLHPLAAQMKHPGLVSAAATGACALATVLSVVAYRRWKAAEIAMRHKAALPWSSVLAWLAGSLSILGIIFVLSFL